MRFVAIFQLRSSDAARCRARQDDGEGREDEGLSEGVREGAGRANCRGQQSIAAAAAAVVPLSK